MAKGQSILIPVANRAEEVEVQVDNLPAVNDVLDLLKAEEAPLHIWLDLAREYFKQKKDEAFLDILREGSGPEVEEVYGDVKYDRIAILNALGAYYSNLGRTTPNKRHKDDHFIAAVDFYNKAARIDPQEVTTWVGKGQLQVAKGEWEQAAEMFKCALETQPDHVAALVGQACVLFNKGRMEEALKSYKVEDPPLPAHNALGRGVREGGRLVQRVLQLHPRCPPAVRLGIALCHHRLAETNPSLATLHYAKARQAFERVLELDAANVEALVGLGVMEMNAGAVEAGVGRLRSAYQVYPYSAQCLNAVNNHLFRMGQHGLLDPLQEAALTCTDHPLMHAESLYFLGRSCHANWEYSKAASYYRAAMKEAGAPHQFLLPFYAMAQLHVQRGNGAEALALLHQVLTLHPTNAEALKAAAAIHAQQGRTKEALACLRKATEAAPSDLQAWTHSADLLAHTDQEEALKALTAARKIVEARGDNLPLPLLNNLGVLHMERGEVAAAREVLSKGLGEVGEAIPLTKLSLLYNRARLYEAEHHTEQAAAIYEKIRTQYPFYTDASIRLAHLAQARGQWGASITLLEGLGPVVDALLLTSRAQMEVGAPMEAKASLRKALPDLRAVCALGNWNLTMSTRPSKDPKAQATHLEKAGELFHRALSDCPSNLYAAHGIGCVLAAKGLLEAARAIFSQVQEAAAANPLQPFPDVWTNQAHLMVLRGQTALALKMYANCQTRFFFGTEEQLHLFTAKAWYEAEELRQCSKALLVARRLGGPHSTLKFNLGACLQKAASSRLQSKPARVAEVVAARGVGRQALEVFQQLAADGVEEHKCRMHTEYCQTLLLHSQGLLEAAEREEKAGRVKMELKAAQQESARVKREMEGRQQLEEVVRLRAEEEKRSADMAQRLSERQAKWGRSANPGPEEEAGEKKEKKKKRKQLTQAEEAEEEVEEEQEEEEGGDAEGQERKRGRRQMDSGSDE